MSEVTDAPRSAAKEDTPASARGDFIWYELMTTDAEGAKAFYDAVVGWDIGEGAAEFQGYRMINSEGGFAGGVLPLTDEMLRELPSGDLFGLSQNAGMGWSPAEMTGPQFLLLSTQGGLRSDDGTPVAPDPGCRRCREVTIVLVPR